MKEPLYTNEKFSCDGVVRQQKVNCEHWGVDEKACQRSCSLKGFIPTNYDCHKCAERQPMVTEVDMRPKITPLTINQYGKSVISQMVSGKVDQSVYDQRKSACMGCDQRVNPNPNDESIGWCSACGCGLGSSAALSKKLWMPKATCPKKLFGPSRGSGFTIADAKDAIQNMKDTAKNIMQNPQDGA